MKQYIITYKSYFILFVCLLVIATFLDLYVVSFINSKSLYGSVIQKIGCLPGYYLYVISFTLLCRVCTQKVLSYFIKIVYLFSILFVGYEAYHFLSWIGILLHVLLVFLILAITYRIKEENFEYYYKVAIAILCICIITNITNESMKLLWGRVRPRSLDTHALWFRNWYEIQGRTFLTRVGSMEEIKSFPSGHASWAGLSICYCLLAQYKQKRLKIISVVFIIMVMIGRGVVGAHYPSDVIVGAAIALFVYSVVTYKMHL